ncbi:MAG: hypothetical protein WBX00_08260 [Isosphaeraceae bacterium]
MDKKQERRVFDAVFGRLGLTVAEQEEPDFVCSQPGMENFGVEVTEFFLTESDARLERIGSYACDLIAGGDYRHKDDPKEIKVQNVIYRSAPMGQEIPLNAIGRPIPPHRESLSTLLPKIAHKNGKFPRYRQRVECVDLVVNDVNNVLRFETVWELLTPIVFDRGLATVLDSPFREIYVVTRNTKRGDVCVPFRANLFAGEISLFSSVYNQFRGEVRGPNTVGDYVNALATYLVTRFPTVMHCTAPDVVRFVFGSVSWEFTPEQKIQITDISCANKNNWGQEAGQVRYC